MCTREWVGRHQAPPQRGEDNAVWAEAPAQGLSRTGSGPAGKLTPAEAPPGAPLVLVPPPPRHFGAGRLGCAGLGRALCILSGIPGSAPCIFIKKY